MILTNTTSIYGSIMDKTSGVNPGANITLEYKGFMLKWRGINNV